MGSTGRDDTAGEQAGGREGVLAKCTGGGGHSWGVLGEEDTVGEQTVGGEGGASRGVCWGRGVTAGEGTGVRESHLSTITLSSPWGAPRWHDDPLPPGAGQPPSHNHLTNYHNLTTNQ